MKIAVPVAGGQLCPHFGHCEQFEIFEIDPNTKAVMKSEAHTPPPHEPGVLPRWLSEMGATLVIAGGMGSRAQNLFQQNRIGVIIGAMEKDPEKVVLSYLNGILATEANICDH